MNRRTVYLYWALLAVPTLFIAASAVRLLRHERERMERQALTAAENRVRTVAESLQLSVSGVQDEIQAQLRNLPSGSLLDALLRWQDSNPLIRHVFVWQDASGLRYPGSDRTATAEERRFVARYEALFTGRMPWQTAGPDAAAASPPEPAPPEPQQAEDLADNAALETDQVFLAEVQQLRGTGREMERVARQSARRETPPPRTGRGAAAGWIPWLSDNRLSLLAWRQRPEAGVICGVEVELAALLSRLIAAFPRTVPPGSVLAVTDDGGRIVHQVGSAGLPPGARPQVHASLSPQLPHWDVVAFFPGGVPGAAAARTSMALSVLLLGILAVAVLAGGSLLMRSAQLHMLDAARKTTFVSNVSHELKTPLTSIRLYAELLAQDRVRDEDRRRKYLAVIAAETERLTRLVNNVLDFSRLEQGRRKYDPQDLDLAAFLRDFADAHRLRIESAGLRLNTETPADPVNARTDRDAIEQTLLNLVDNAVKYAAGGGELTLALDCANGRPRIRVCDRGPGVPARHRGRIFEKFYRADDSLTAHQPGSGLGLSIARALMRGQGGDVVYEPREGGGSCFTALLGGGDAAPAPADGPAGDNA